jgi:transporter family-2 protein
MIASMHFAGDTRIVDRDTQKAFSFVVPVVGALITLMSAVNTRLAGIAGSLAATLVIHVAGLAAVSAVILVKRERARPGQLPAWYYLGGFVGVGTVFASIYAFTVLGASLAVSLSLLGQTFFSLVVDATGILGRRKYPISVRSLPGIGLAIAGVAVISTAVLGRTEAAAAAESWLSNLPALLIALVAGVLPGLSFILNSELGRTKGIWRSTRANYVVGLATTLVIVAAVRPPVAGIVDAVHAVAAAGPVLALGGGFMGVVVVAAMNLVFPRISAFSATLLLFSGQALSGVVIDLVAEGAFDARKLIGTLALLLGLAVNALLSRKAASGAGAGGPGATRQGP